MAFVLLERIAAHSKSAWPLQKRASARQSVVVVQSLTDTLREAMRLRNESMNMDEDEDDEDAYDWLG